MIGPRVDSSQPARDDLTVVVGEVRESADACDVTGAEHAGAHFERRRIDLQPTTFRRRKSGCAPCLGIRTTARRHQETGPSGGTRNVVAVEAKNAPTAMLGAEAKRSRENPACPP